MANRDRHAVTLCNYQYPPVQSTQDMKIGQYAVVLSDNGNNKGRIICRIWRSDSTLECVAIDNPHSTWDNPNFAVRILEPGEFFKVVVGE